MYKSSARSPSSLTEKCFPCANLLTSGEHTIYILKCVPEIVTNVWVQSGSLRILVQNHGGLAKLYERLLCVESLLVDVWGDNCMATIFYFQSSPKSCTWVVLAVITRTLRVSKEKANSWDLWPVSRSERNQNRRSLSPVNAVTLAIGQQNAFTQLPLAQHCLHLMAWFFHASVSQWWLMIENLRKRMEIVVTHKRHDRQCRLIVLPIQ